MNSSITVSLLITLAVLSIVFGPVATIWALNTLFPVLAIPYTFWTWLGAAWINYSIFGSNALNKSKA